MIKSKIFSIILLIIFTVNSFSAGSSSDSGTTKTLYDKAVSLIEIAKKMEEKGKTEKANKRYKKAQKFLIKSNHK